jgi:hypothetical protein
MPEHELAQETVLTLYLDAKLAQAQAELLTATDLHKRFPNKWTNGRHRWAEHQVAVIRALRRDAERPGQIIARYLRLRKAPCRTDPY